MKTNTITSLAIKGLSGAVTLAGATQAYGAVVAADPPAATAVAADSLSNRDGTLWDVDGDGTDDFALGAFVFPKGDFGDKKVLFGTGFYGPGSNALVGYAGTAAGAQTILGTNLSTGTTVGPTSAFAGYYGEYSVLGAKYGKNAYGQFAAKGGTTGFVGFEFSEADGTHYGYGEFTSILQGSGSKVTATLIYDEGYYETTPNMPIVIGGAVPEPTSLAALAFGVMGAAGAAAYRRQQAA